MKLKRSLQHVTTCKSDAQKKKNGNALVHNFVALSACATLAMILAVGTKVAEFGPRSQVYAASDKENRSADAWTDLGSVEYDLPTMEDILKVSTCDLFIYVGGESDSWVADALKGAGNPDRKAINLMDVLGDQVKEEEIVEGMQDEDGHTHEEEHTHDDDLEYDEHVWLSLKNASLFCDTIASSLADADPEHSRLYQQNAEDYEEKLAALDQEYQTSVEKSQSKTLLFADRFPFRYLIDDYNLTYYAAFAGCSAETDASFETITFLAGKLDALNLPAVLTIENSDQKVAKAVIENTNTKDQKILTLNSMQSVTTKDVEEGTTYLSIMENNLQILKEAL